VFENEDLKSHLQSSFTINSGSALIAEWNMNIPGNVFKLGNYRYRKSSTQYNAIPNSFDRTDSGRYYTNALNSDIVVESGFKDNTSTPLLFQYTKDKETLYYSLEDCLKPFRPRSGINKASFFSNKYISNVNKDMYLRPRYYMSHRDDEFKYWRSYRTESSGTTTATSNIEYGISKNSTNAVHFIDDTVPFVVYKEQVPANRLVMKVQTHVGDINLGPFKGASGSTPDPLFGENNKVVPKRFKVEYLNATDQWITAYTFADGDLREDNTPIFGSDGYLSLEYGLQVPAQYKDNFILIGTIDYQNLEVTPAELGNAYLVPSEIGGPGTLYVYNGSSFVSYPAEYKWKIGTDGVYENTQFVTDITNPDYFTSQNTSVRTYREFVWIKGMRIIVESMSIPNVPFELIEFSPRLVVDLTGKLVNFKVTKVLSNMTSTPLPVGELVSSTGSLTLFDDDSAFNINNAWDGDSGSILAKYVQKNTKFSFYEVVKNVNGINYYVPIKNLYSEGIPQTDQGAGTISINLRDFYFYFESIKAPEILLTEVSLGQAVCILLDSIGFSNYIFKRLPDESDPVIPFFFISPEQNVAEVLNKLAVATQTAMFFDEYNNFVVMSKNYMLDDTNTRTLDMTLYGSQNEIVDGINENTYPTQLSNIIDVSSQDQKVYNAGTINYTSRYIQRSYGSLKQSQMTEQEKTWIYKPVLLWEVAGTESTKTLNNEKQQKYTLGAMPLNSTLSASIPTVVSRQIVNNILDFGENIFYITRFQGYFYANGEIIKYDAVEYNVTGTGNVWITTNLEYQKYFSQLPFNGKIYPTGLVRIYSEPYYETIDGITKIKNGAVVSHGRGQFNTPIVAHSAGIDSYWTNNNYVQGCDMQSQYLYTTTNDAELEVESGAAGLNKQRADKSQRNSIIRNFLSTAFATETGISAIQTAQAGTIQSSALVMNGPEFAIQENPRNFVSYVWKKLDGAYKHFGTRLRIIGKIEAAGDRSQSPVGGMTYYNIPGLDPTQTVSIGGGSGGIALVNPTTNNGYYFELSALTSSSVERFLTINPDSGSSEISVDNILFYKVQKAVGSSVAIPTKLWGGSGNILVDDGNFTGQYRFVGEENPTVYDLSMEYVDVNSTTRVFYLYLNQKLIKVITDEDPIPLVDSSIGLFVRGTSKVMFENVYALGKNYADNAVFDLNTPIASVFGDDNMQINASEALNKYAMSGVIQKTYLTGISPTSTKAYNMYFEEFGTIMRECAYFNVKYDRAYPALYAQIAPTFNRLRGYTVSGFSASSYGAEFLIFNNTDTLLNLDETTGNYLRIFGITFTQDTTNKITVDDFYKKRGSLSDPELKGDVVISSPYKFTDEYDSIKTSRLLYGKNEFTLDSEYIQDQDTAEDILGWVIQKNLRPRKAIGLQIFPMPTLQVGDLVNINYKDNDGIDVLASPDTRFVVYNIEYSKAVEGPNMAVYLSEV
jgi:hypothetical protein